MISKYLTKVIYICGYIHLIFHITIIYSILLCTRHYTGAGITESLPVRVFLEVLFQSDQCFPVRYGHEFTLLRMSKDQGGTV